MTLLNILSAIAENEKYLDSIQGRLDLFSNSLQKFWSNLIDSKTVKTAVDAGTYIINLLDTAHGKVIALVAAVKLMAKFKGFSLKGIGMSLAKSIKQISIAQQSLANLTSNPATKLGQGYDPTNVNLYAAAVSNLTVKQQANMLASTGLSKAQIQLALQYNGLSEDAIREATAHVFVKQAKDQESLSDQQLLANKILLSTASLKLAGDTDSLAVAEYLEANASELAAAADAKQMIMASSLSDAQKAAALAAIGQANANIKLGTSIKALFASNPVGFILTIATTLASILIPTISKVRQSAKEATDEAIKSADEINSARKSIDEYKKSIEDLRKKLADSTISEQEAYDARAQLIDIQNQLIEKFGSEAEGINLVTGAIKDQIGAIDELARKSAEDWIGTNNTAYQNAIKTMNKTYSSNDFIVANETGTTTRVTDQYGQIKFKNEITSQTLGSVSKEIRDAYSNGLKKIIEDVGGKIKESTNGGSYGATGYYSKDFLASFEGKTVEELDAVFKEMQSFLIQFSAKNGVDLNDRINQLEQLRKKYVDEDYEKARELYNQGRQQEAYAKYSSEYGAILDAQDAFYKAATDKTQLEALKQYNQEVADAFVAAGGEISEDGVFNIDKNSTNTHMQKFFADMQTKFDQEEFELKIKTNEDDLKSEIENIIKDGGENGLSALDDNQIKDLATRYKNGEFESRPDGATVDYSRYTKEQVVAMAALEAQADAAGISVECLIDILVNLGLIAGRPAEAAAEGVKAVGQAYSALSESAEKYKDITEILNELTYDNIEITQEQYDVLKELIGSEEEFADCIDNSNGYIVKNTALTKKLVDQKKKEQAADVKLAKSQARLEYYKLVKQLNNTLNSTKKLDAATMSFTSSILAQIDAVGRSIYKYQLLEDSLLGVSNAFSEFDQAKEIDALNTYADSYVEMAQTIYDAFYKTGEIGTVANQTAIEALIDPNKLAAYAKGTQEYYQAVYDAFNTDIKPNLTLDDGSLSFEFKNVEKFISDNLGTLFSGASVKDFDLVEGMSLDKAVELTGKTKTELYAMFALLKDYTGVDFLSILDDSTEGRILQLTSKLEDLNRQKLALLENGEYEANKDAIDAINQEIAKNSQELNKLGKEAYSTWQEYTKNDAVIAALNEIEDKTKFLTKEAATSFGLEWDEVKGQTVQQALDSLLTKQLELEEPTVLTAQLAIDNIDNQIAELETSINSNDFSNVDPVSLGLEVDATPEEIKAAIESKIASLKEDMAVISTTFGIELNEEQQLKLENELNSIETFVIHDKEFSVIVNGVSEANQLLNSVKDTLTKIKDKSIRLTTYDTTYKSTKRYNPATGEWEYSFANGTAHTQGTAHANGSWGAPKTETALMGELGREIIVDPKTSKWRTVGDNGAEFTTVPRGSIVFNHKQTEQLLKNGYITSRGKLQGGSALASGTAYATTWNPIKGSDSGSGSGNSADDAKDQFEELFDWIEVRLEEINKQLDFKNARLDNSVGFSKQNAVINEMLDLNEKLYDNLITGANKYYEYANKLLEKVPAEYRQAAQDGSIAIEEFAGEADKKTLEAIKDFREWIQKADDAVQQAEEVLTENSSLAKQAIDNIATDFGNKNSIRDNIIDQLDAYNALAETKYGNESEAIYQDIIKNTNENIKALQTQRDEMQAELNKQVKAGNIKKYSQDWYDAVNDIAAVDTEIINLTTDTYDYQDSINELHWDHFDNLLSRLEAISNEADNLIDILGSKDLVDETGNWTNEGITSLGLYAQKMEVAEMQAQKYADEIDYLNENWEELGYTEQEYLEKLAELKEGQYDAIKSYNDSKDAIVDLNKARIDAIKDGIQKEIDAYSELIKKKKEELDAEKDLHDFQKGVMEQQKDIADLERQLAALSADNSASARAKRAKLEAELAEARADLEETYYDRSISNQQDALDKELENFQESKDKEMEGWDEYLENTEQVVADSLSTVQANTDTVYQTLKVMGEEYSLSIAESLTSPWKDGENAIQSYSEKFGLAMSSTVEELKELEAEYKELMNEIENSGEKFANQVDDNAKSYTEAEYKEPAKKEEQENEKPKDEEKKPSLTKGSYVELKPGTRWYADSYGGGASGKAKSGKIKYINEKGSHPYNIDGAGWVRKKDIKGYKLGTTNIGKSDLYNLDELGEELIIRAHNGRITYLEKGSGVVPADVTSNLMQWGRLDPTIMLDQNRPSIDVHPEIHNTEIKIDNSIAELIHIDKCETGTLPDVKKIVDEALEKHTQRLNNSLRKYAR